MRRSITDSTPYMDVGAETLNNSPMTEAATTVLNYLRRAITRLGDES